MNKEAIIYPYQETDVIKRIICYPRCDIYEFEYRLKQLKRLGIDFIISYGPTQIGKIFVLGKGCTSIVVKALRHEMVVALKIRRTDANRKDLVREAEILKIVNRYGVGPRLIDYTPDILVMEYIEGVEFGEWIERVQDDQAIKNVLKKLLEKLYVLDSIGICHLELSNPRKHIVIVEEKPVILDFETVSTKTTKTNITQVLNYLIFRKNKISDKVTRILELRNIGLLKTLLRKYKKERTSEIFLEVIKTLNLS